ncbi:MAG: N-acetylmuramoyl-L-alanine amidase [Elusimicrobiaceae bacterium]|nr:N-acetylmuramoyl-L-alanine amidase [Elusimicrobiaceae bacterium]
MFKKLILTLFAWLFFCSVFAADTLPVVFQGKNKTPIATRTVDGEVFVEARDMAKYLRLQTNLFWNSGQLNLRGKNGFFATLKQGDNFATVKGKRETLTADPFMEKRSLYAPITFFTEGSGFFAGNFQAAFDGEKIIIEKAGELPVIEKKKEEIKTPAQAEIKEEITDEEIEEVGGEFFEQVPGSNLPAPTVINKLDTSKKNLPFVPIDLKKENVLRVCIDAGHGGKDPGANYRGIAREKELNLIVAKELEKLLKKNKKIQIKMTRSTDVFIPLGTRAKIANDFKADLFVSIHANAAPNKKAKGFEVYFRSDKASDKEAAQTAALENEALNYEEKGVGSVTYADLLLNSLATNENINESSKLAARIRNGVSEKSKTIGINVSTEKSIKQANFYVLQGVKAPSVLVEMGYVTNKDDKKRLNNKKILQIIAMSINNGILNYARQEGWKV